MLVIFITSLIDLLLFILVFIVVAFAEIRHNHTKHYFHIKNNNKLCSSQFSYTNNNGQCLTAGYSHSVSCDARLQTSSGEQYNKDNFCLGLHVSVVNLSHAQRIFNFIDEVNFNISIRQISIEIRGDLNGTDFSKIGHSIDKFLTPNMWWQVVTEPFSWTLNDTQSNHIVLERCHQNFEPHLRLLSSIQFPTSSDTCSSSALLINRNTCEHPGWGSVLWFYFEAHRDMPYAVMGSHVSTSNSLSDSTAFISGVDCGHTHNRWDCAFLSMTNCTMPSYLTSNMSHNFVGKLPETVHFSTLFNTATADGVTVFKDDSIYPVILNNSQFPSSQRQSVLSPHTQPPQFVYKPPHQLTAANNWTKDHWVDAAFSMHTHRFLLRKNHFYRSRVAEKISAFYVHNNLTSSSRCVSAQVRRGDRVIYGVNMTEFCRNATTPITLDNPVNLCLNSRQQLKDCDTLMGDKGCETVPFGAVTLEGIVDQAEYLVGPEVRNLFVFTDDQAWLNEERLRLHSTHPQWRVFDLAPPQRSQNTTHWDDWDTYSGYHHMRARGGTSSGVFFHASLDLTQQCEAFIGHFESEIPVLFYSAMCSQHGRGDRAMQGVCPPMFNVGRKLN